MIPVGLPSVEFLLAVLALLLTTVVWVGWSVCLLLSRNGIRGLRGTRLAVYLAVALVSLFTLFKIAELMLALSASEREQALHYRPTLATTQKIEGIEMPAGTRLTLSVAAQLSSFTSARFPAAIPLLGVNTLHLERYVRIEHDEEFNPISTLALNQRLTGEGNSPQRDWICDASHPIVFELEDGQLNRFERCTLASGNRLEGIALATGTEVRASEGNTYTDGFIDLDRWVLDVPQSQTITLDSVPLRSPVISLDSQRQIYEVSRAELSQPVLFGDIEHAAGTLAHLNPRSLRKRYPNAWLFTAADGFTLIQSRSGKILESTKR